MPPGLHAGSPVFVDTGAWIALALTRDPLHERAVDVWGRIQAVGARVVTSIPVVLETFTFLERNTRLDLALAWKDRLLSLPRVHVLECTPRDLEACWAPFRQRKHHKLSATDATSLVLMKRERIRLAFAFDHHFPAAGFRLVE